MNPLLIPPLIQAGSAVAGGLMSLFGQKRANDANRELYEDQKKTALENFHRQNEYNSPANQRARYEQAGINPYMALGNITAGNAQGVSSATPVAQQPLTGLGDAVSRGGEAMANVAIASQQAQAGIRLTQAQENKTDEEARGLSIDNAVKRDTYHIELSKKFYDGEISRAQYVSLDIQNKFAEQANPKQIEILEMQIKQEKERLASIELDNKIKDYELNEIKPQEKQVLIANVREIGARAKLLLSQTALTDEEKLLVGAKVLDQRLQSLGYAVELRERIVTQSLRRLSLALGVKQQALNFKLDSIYSPNDRALAINARAQQINESKERTKAFEIDNTFAPIDRAVDLISNSMGIGEQYQSLRGPARPAPVGYGKQQSPSKSGVSLGKWFNRK